LLYLLDWFNGRDLGNTKLSLVCIGEFPGVEDFRGLGQLNAAQLASLFDQRREVTATEMALGSAAWEAYRAPNPTAIERILSDDTAPLPFLRAALLCHLARFPSRENGLGQVENCALDLIDQGLENFTELFAEFSETEPVYGLGDFQLWLVLRKLVEASTPLLVMENGASLMFALDSAKLRATNFTLTQQGVAVLQRKADFVELNSVNEWLGGVHLAVDHLWRWDEVNNRLCKSGV